jgi:hypothetical protein
MMRELCSLLDLSLLRAHGMSLEVTMRAGPFRSTRNLRGMNN